MTSPRARKADGRGDDEKGDLRSARVEALPKYGGDFAGAPWRSEMAGSSAAETDMPKRLTGKV